VNDELRQMREEITALRLAAQGSQRNILARLDGLEKLLIQRTARQPGWRFYLLLLAAALVGWVLPR
jgi:hypothetical protein